MQNCKNGSIPAHLEGSEAIQCMECIDWLNRARLMLIPRVDNSIDSNQTVAGNYAIKMVHEYDMEELFRAMKRHEAIAAAMSLIYNERLIAKRIADPKELERRADDWKAAEKEMRNANRPKAEKKMLSDFDKAVAQLTAVGVSEPNAIEIVKERFAKQGKVTQ